jgi:hypothetical protein
MVEIMRQEADDPAALIRHGKEMLLLRNTQLAMSGLPLVTDLGSLRASLLAEGRTELVNGLLANPVESPLWPAVLALMEDPGKNRRQRQHHVPMPPAEPTPTDDSV